MKRISLLLLLPLFLVLLTNCEDPIDVPSPFEQSTLVVDAWISNTNEAQTIRLSESVDYFLGGAPPAVTGAEVVVCRNDGEQCFTFVEAAPGDYIWQPEGGVTLGEVGDRFELIVNVREQELRSETELKRTARLDSIALTFEEESLFDEEGIYAQVYARDQPGQGDTYWVKVWKNDTLLNRPSEVIISYDGAFDRGTDIDGLYFLPPLREITPLDDEGGEIPYVPGDNIYVEVHSISNVAWSFLAIGLEQIQNSGIFAVPVANAEGNVRNITNGEDVLGIFNVAEVATISRLVE